MRYLHCIGFGLAGFAAFGVMLACGGASHGIWLPLVGGVAAGAVFGGWSLWSLRRHLVGDKQTQAMREVPGGIWFFLVLGALVGVAGLTIRAHDEGLAVDLGLALCTMLFTGFAFIGAWVRRQEKKYGKEVWIGPGGPAFRSPD
jgi:hypothetical protein